MAAKKVVTDVEGCERCGGRHNGLKLKAFTNPVLDTANAPEDVVLFTHYAMCPKMGQPILALVTDEPDEEST